MDDPGQLFDQVLASSVSRVATGKSLSSSAAAILPLRKYPTARYLPAKQREMAAVDESLKTVLRRLVTGQAKWPLFLHGPPGTGKSCAALALLDFVEHGWYATVAELTSVVMDTFGTNRRFEWKALAGHRIYEQGTYCERSYGTQLVVLDELGVREKVTDTHYECLQRVIDMREGLPLILISNLDIAKLGGIYDARIASRCEAGTVVMLGGRDRRVS